jgi:hypothetical protein
LNSPALQAQVTIGSEYAPTKAALLELKDRQAGTVTSVSDPNNATSTSGGFLLPRVELASVSTLEPFISANDPDFKDDDQLKLKLAGLMVYNITNQGSLYPAVYTWNGLMWVTSQINASVSAIDVQPQAFTFYETGSETIQPLTFTVGGSGTWSYQWYQLVGSNIHVRVATPVGESGTVTGTGADTKSFTPGGIKKATGGSTSTRYAQNNGFYRFYCVATNILGAVLTSEIAEIAVGCGAKNLQGEWLSFMCFNLGADTLTIQAQKDYSITSFTNYDSNSSLSGFHPYFTGEEKIWGSLFQWGRIADGHELRSYTVNIGVDTVANNIQAYSGMSTSEIGEGSRCSNTDTGRPYRQIRPASNWYGKFIFGSSNWNPVTTQSTLDMIWRSERFVQNDPCAHYKIDNIYQDFWHTGTDPSYDAAACTDAGTAWRIPSQDEWGSLYKGGSISGSPGTATANTWSWYGGTSASNTGNRGFEIKPNNEAVTLFLPAGGYRDSGDGRLYGQGFSGLYWITGVSGTTAYSLGFNSGTVNPAYSSNRANGFALRCIKNS